MQKAKKTEQIPDVRLRTAKHGKNFLARLINEIRRDEITESKAKVLIYAANSFIKATEISEFETRIDALERKMNNE